MMTPRQKPEQVRQGHILLDPIDRIPKGAVKLPPTRPGEVVLATGETGREHLFKTERVEVSQEDSQLYIEVLGDEPVYLEHEQHGQIEIQPGAYKMTDQREESGGGGQPRRSPD